MNKYKKVSARTSFKILLEYPYVVEVTGDSNGRRKKVQYVKYEGIRAFNKFDFENTSEDSFTLERKYINLKYVGQKMDSIGVPTHVIVFSQMSRNENMDMIKNLKLKLVQVRSISLRLK